MRKSSIDTITELKAQRKVALNNFNNIHVAKNESLARYFFNKFKEGEDVPYAVLKNIPIGEALLLPVVYGGAIVTIKEEDKSPNTIVHNTKWTSGSTLALHFHSDCNEIVEVVEGNIKVFVEGEIHNLDKGHKIEFAKNIAHQITALCPTELKVIFTRT